MGKRETLYQYFGPKLLEAMLDTFLAELNAVRTEAGLAKGKTKEELETAVETKLTVTPDYPWMTVQRP